MRVLFRDADSFARGKAAIQAESRNSWPVTARSITGGDRSVGNPSATATGAVTPEPLAPGVEHQSKRPTAVDEHRRPDAPDLITAGGRDEPRFVPLDTDFTQFVGRFDGTGRAANHLGTWHVDRRLARRATQHAYEHDRRAENAARCSFHKLTVFF